MTATAWAVRILRGRHPATGPLSSIHGRAVLLGLAALADEALASPAGYMSSSDEEVGRLAGMATSTAASWLRTFVELELVDRLGAHSFRVPFDALTGELER